VNEQLLDEVAARLASLGVRRRDAERVLAEVGDHLAEAARAGGEDPVARFGDPKQFARLVASELATKRTRRATFASLAALALAGCGYTAALALGTAAGKSPDIFAGRVEALGPPIAILMVLLPQLAFVSGCLALLRALRLRKTPVVGSAELALLRRRSNVALAAAVGAVATLAAYAVEFQGELAAWWTWTTVATCTALLAPLAAASYAVSDSACPAAEPAGSAGDIFDDLAPFFRFGFVRRLGFEEHPWRFALVTAAGVGLVAFALGWYAEGDPGSGIVRGALEAVALVICFAALGRALGLRRSHS
jgi:multisubunit Na+/H+ antiporter MnhB subunit